MRGEVIGGRSRAEPVPPPVDQDQSAGSGDLTAQVLRHEIPVDEIPERLDVLGAGIAVIDVIGVFPHVAGEQRRAGRPSAEQPALAVLVILTLPGAVFDQPDPAEAEVSGGRGAAYS